MLWSRRIVPRMTQVKRGGGRPALSKKMQRYSLLKAAGAIVLILGFVALLFQNDPFPGVRKAAMRQRRQAETSNGQEVERDFRDPETKTDQDGAADTEGEEQPEDGSRKFTFELASLKDGATGTIVIETRPSWAPLGVEHFHELMDGNFFDQAKFFRVVKNFIVQFGIPADPKNKRPTPFKDDPVLQTNARGTLTYATSGPNTRSTQLFINTRNGGNAFLDKQGFSPFAEVISGMEYVDAIDDEYGEKPNQGKIQNKGNAYLDKEFPLLSFISKAYSSTAKNEEEEGVN